MKISCEVIRDLLPLYHDDVCSAESRRLVDEHLTDCPACREELKSFETEPAKAGNVEEARLIQRTARAWKKNKAAAFFKGALIVAVLACISCLVAFNVIGSYVAADGTLVEPFGLIPLAWLFAFLGILFAVCFAVVRRRGKRK